MPARRAGPVAGRRQAAPAAPAAPAQTLLTNALLVPLEQLAPDPGQPRRHFDETGIAELAESIRQDGVLQPLLVYEDGTLDDGRIRYRILDGERRYRASGRVRSDVPVIVVTGRDVTDVRIQQLVANLQREELDPLEEALALKQLMQLAHLSLAGVAERIGKPRVYVQRRTDLLFDPRLSEAVRRGEINASVAVELKRFPDDVRHQFLDRVAAGERLEVAQLREEKRRARAIVFGEGTSAPRREGDAGAVTPLYRIDTDSPTTEQSNARNPSGVSGADQVYRIDTDSPATHNVEGEARSDGQSRGARPTENDHRAARAWAVPLADALLTASGARGVRTVLRGALQEWRDAGQPVGWGDLLLRIIDEGLD